MRVNKKKKRLLAVIMMCLVLFTGTFSQTDFYVAAEEENEQAEATVENVTAMPASGSAIASGATITLTTVTEDAEILYSIGTVSGNAVVFSNEQVYTEEQTVTLEGMEGDTIYVKAYAAKDSKTSEEITFEYQINNQSGNNSGIFDPVTEDMIEENVLTIKEALAETIGTSMTVIGQVAYIYGSKGKLNTVLLQDVINNEVVGLQIYDTSNAATGYQVGDVITVTGKTALYGGVTQISSPVVTIVQAGVQKFEPQEISISEFLTNTEQYISEYLCIKNVTLGAYSTSNTAISDETGTVNIYQGVSYPDGIAEGSNVNIFAAGSKFNATKQLRNGLNTDYFLKEYIDTSITKVIAGFAGTAAPTEKMVYGDLNGGNDGLDKNSMLTLSTDAIPVVNKSNIGSVGLTENQFYQIVTSTRKFGALQISFRMKGSNTGASAFQLQYSTDGTNYFPAGDGNLKCSYTQYSNGESSSVNVDNSCTSGQFSLVTASKYHDISFTLPSAANHAEALFLRIVVTSSKSINNGTIGKSGTNYLTEIKLSGSPIISDSITKYVTANPGAGEITAGTEVTLSSETKSATIFYSINSSEYVKYSGDAKPVLTEFPVTLNAYAQKEGQDDSIVMSYSYTQAQVATVKASPNGGSVAEGTSVQLTTATEGADILYKVVKQDELAESAAWITYTGKIKLEEFPAVIYAKGVKDGYIDSETNTFSFTKRENEKYNIYFGQLHSHTNYSDGAGSCEEAFNYGKNTAENLDFLAVTDHSNSLDNADSSSIHTKSAGEWTEGHALAAAYTDSNFVGIYGYEMTWSNGLGHMNTFNTDGFQSRTQSEYTDYSTALQNYYATLKTAPASINQFNHPGTTFGDFSDFAHYDEEIDPLITMIEVGNGEGSIGSSGYFPSYEYYTRALDKGWHVAPTNNQDNHKGLWGSANTARSVVLADTLTEENIYDAMRNMRMYATEDNDLSIQYTLDGNIMGTILEEGSTGETVELKAEFSDPTDSKIGTVEVIVNGGIVADSTTISTNEAEVTFTVPSTYSYYYIKVVEEDGDIAVTAPVWISDVEAVGIAGMSTTAALPVQGESLDVNLELYNNENTALEINSIEFKIGNETIHTVDLAAAGLTTLASLKSQSYQFHYTYDKAGSIEITAVVTGRLNGAAKKYSSVLQLNYVAQNMVTKVVVDGTHYNDYVTGYYGGNVGNVAELFAESYAQVTVVKDNITKEILDDCNLLIISAPAKKAGTANGGAYTVSHFEDSYIELVKEYVNKGGNIIFCGLADYSDTADCQSSTEINRLLEAIGASMRLNSDEIVDDDANGGQAYRLFFDDYNTNSNYTRGITSGQTYSSYSGCSVILDETKVAAGTCEPIVNGHATTYSLNTKTVDNYYKEIGKGNIVAMGRETLPTGSNIFLAGTVFLSDFELKKEVDNGNDLQYSNRNIILNILDNSAVKVPVSTIAEARKGELGDVYCVEGYVTAGTELESNTFFDAIYVQDNTGGITIFPYSTSGLKIGTKIRIIGYVDEYQGDRELQVIKSEILDDKNLHKVTSKVLTTAQATDYDSFGGQLVTIKGTVTEITPNGSALSQCKVKDSSGVEATVFIDGYILSSKTGKNTLADSIKEGKTIYATGLLYKHPEGASNASVTVLRVRDCREVFCVSSKKKSDESTSQEGNAADTTKEDETVKTPGKVTEISTSSNKETSITIAWEKAEHADGYLIEIYNNATKKWETVKLTTKISQTITGLKEATTYKFRVTSYIKESGKKVYGKAGTTITTSTVTAKVKNVKIQKTAEGEARLSWDKVSGADGYVIEMKTGKGAYKKVKTIGKGSAQTYTISELKEGKSYTFRIRTYVKVGKTKLYSSYVSKKKKV
ncbi:CehA/McbA family metallohydrolase [Anaeromicropila populeti]|uniref:Chitobiase/beta-hexosaminidase C-terminal domain-containing protein n=1 Tax=Anaeromicropila populeti TaxID=37658 RepID=A0A1I6KAU9_9FIRM|nr:CehA/McbA family metallohydrolase [Anaeromicropila populeti]SFR88415.1 Chitobiase/beta-hexosaminidase C-terminal domain-containing protein [Anaeromicropila populeti]